VPPHRNGLSALAIIGIVAVMLVVLIATGIGIAAALGHGTQGQYASDFKDSLDGSTSAAWPSTGGCYYQGSAYHASPANAGHSIYCESPAGSVSDFDTSVTVSQVAGPLDQEYGLGFRHAISGSYDVFLITSDGHAEFSKLFGGQWIQITHDWQPTRFNRGLNTKNSLRVVGHGSTFSFYVNGAELGQVQDSTYARGTVGVFSGEYGVDAAYTNFEVKGNP
jgi:hypothetical protein